MKNIPFFDTCEGLFQWTVMLDCCNLSSVQAAIVWLVIFPFERRFRRCIIPRYPLPYTEFRSGLDAR